MSARTQTEKALNPFLTERQLYDSHFGRKGSFESISAIFKNQRSNADASSS